MWLAFKIAADIIVAVGTMMKPFCVVFDVLIVVEMGHRLIGIFLGVTRFEDFDVDCGSSPDGCKVEVCFKSGSFLGVVKDNTTAVQWNGMVDSVVELSSDRDVFFSCVVGKREGRFKGHRLGGWEDASKCENLLVLTCGLGPQSLTEDGDGICSLSQ